MLNGTLVLLKLRLLNKKRHCETRCKLIFILFYSIDCLKHRNYENSIMKINPTEVQYKFKVRHLQKTKQPYLI